MAISDYDQPDSLGEWLHYVDLELISLAGMTHLDIADRSIWEQYHGEGKSAREAASICLGDVQSQFESDTPALGCCTEERL